MPQRNPTMIVNHQYKYIFIKTRKTAGTSIEIALSQYCGENDIITKISDEDELIRQKFGFTGPQNYDIPFRYNNKQDWCDLIVEGKQKEYINHSGAQFIKDHIGKEIWDSYFKFCFERNPFDKAISRYYWSTREPRPAISDYLATAPIFFLSNWDTYTVNDDIAVDFVGRYENLNEDLDFIRQKIGLEGELRLPRAKGAYRKNRDHYSRVLDQKSRSRIEVVCAKENAYFDYHWEIH